MKCSGWTQEVDAVQTEAGAAKVRSAWCYELPAWWDKQPALYSPVRRRRLQEVTSVRPRERSRCR
jgi:hypothetical protein